MIPQTLSRIAACALLLLGTWQVAGGAWIHAKAFVAQALVAAAWTRAQAAGVAPRPWPGADMRPVARLSMPRRSIALYVMDSSTPRALAFGPAYVGGTAAPGSWGNTVMVAHRDTHFAFLRHVEMDDAVEVEALRGARASYRVREIAVLDKDDARALAAPGEGRLTLITCWPFDAVQPGSRLRYVVIADRVA